MAAPAGNQYAIGNNGGRPPHYETPEELTTACDAYFEYILGEFHTEKQAVLNPETEQTEMKDVKVWDRFPEPATVTGLALYLGFCHRSSLDDYSKKEEFSHIIKKARSRVEHAYEKNLYADKPTGAIFALKNMGWVDAQNLNHGGQDGKNPINNIHEHKVTFHDYGAATDTNP